MDVKKHLGLITVLVLVFLLYSPALQVFFSQDDFFHLSLGQTYGLNSIIELVKPYHGINYRPVFQLTTWFLYKLFGFHPWLFHLVQLIIHLLTVWLFFLIIKKLYDKRLALWASFFYGLSPCLFMAIYWWGASHVLLMAFFSLLSFYLLFNYPWFSSLLFLMALFSNELAVIFPLIALPFLIYRKRVKLGFFLLIPLFAYLFVRFVFSPPSFTYDYEVSVNILSLLRNLRWYVLRMLGLPEGIKILLQEQEFFLLTLINVLLTILNGMVFVRLLYLKLKKFNLKRDFVFVWGVLWFFLGGILVFPLVFHQSSFYLVLSLMGFGLFLSFLLNKFVKKKAERILIGLLYIALSFTSLVLSQKTHWITRRANLARKNIDQVAQKFNDLKDEEVMVFLNENQVKATEVYLSMSGADALRVYYKNHKLKVLFEGYDEIPKSKNGVYFFKARE